MNAKISAAQVAAQAQPCPNQVKSGVHLRTAEQLEIASQGAYEAESSLHHMPRNVLGKPSHAGAKAFTSRLKAINRLCMSTLMGGGVDTIEHMPKMQEGT